MNVTHFSDPEAFYARIEPYLLPTEAEHNLTFGLLSNIRQHPERFPDAVMVLVEDQSVTQVVALRTDAQHHLILSKAQSLDAIAPLADDLFRVGVKLTGVNGLNDESGRFAEAWARLNECKYRVNTPMRTFKLEHVNPVEGVNGRLRRAKPEDRNLLAEWELAFMHEAFAAEEHRAEDAARAVDNNLNSETGGIFVWDDGGVVSYTAYKGPTPHGIRIGPVYTPPNLRGHGYASACVAGVSQYLLDQGYQFCFLFTDLRNPTSNHIYQVIGYEAVADFTEYMFE